MRKYSLFWVFSLCALLADAKTARYRCTWVDDPATSMLIGWDQVSGTGATLYYDVADYGAAAEKYKGQKKPERAIKAKGMNNLFVNLTGLQPNTLYYFVIKDSEGISKRMSFRTANNDPNARISLIAGGDSRNHRDARQAANQLVAKLHPHVVMFNGDMTDSDTDEEWVEWLDDWQYTITTNGHLTPVMVVRGNHESENKTLADVFCLKAKDVYYAFSIGGNLLRVYTLNSMMPAGGDQKTWFIQELEQSKNATWKIVQYHCPIRPHNAAKPERNDQYQHWVGLFQKYGIKLAIESDAHIAKNTYPIRASDAADSQEGFIRDDAKGTTYIGEGCWGAPLRPANDAKDWTRQSGSFNHFNWIWVDKHTLEIRTVKTDNAEAVAALPPNEWFKLPAGIELWKHNQAEAIVLKQATADDDAIAGVNNGKKATEEAPVEKITADVLGIVNVSFEVDVAAGMIEAVLKNSKNQEVETTEFRNLQRGTNTRQINVKKYPVGKYRLLLKRADRIIKQYDVVRKS